MRQRQSTLIPKKHWEKAPKTGNADRMAIANDNRPCMTVVTV